MSRFLFPLLTIKRVAMGSSASFSASPVQVALSLGAPALLLVLLAMTGLVVCLVARATRRRLWQGIALTIPFAILVIGYLCSGLFLSATLHVATVDPAATGEDLLPSLLRPFLMLLLAGGFSIGTFFLAAFAMIVPPTSAHPRRPQET